MRLARGFRGEEGRPGALAQEFDHLTAQVRGGWKVEHNADGGHTTITADTATIDGETQVGGPYYLSADGVITPPQIVANQNDYNPKGLASAITLRLNSDASRDLTGLQVEDESRGRRLRVFNVGGFDLVLKHASASSRQFNRFSCPNGADVTLDSGDGCDLEFDAITKVWRVVGV